MDSFPDLYLEGLRLFNQEEFFEAHEVLEELWTETVGDEKKFYQGLIQASVALFHFGNENFGGARKVYASARKYLEAYGDEYGGIPLMQFLVDLEFCFHELLESREPQPADIRLRDDRVPKIPVPENAGE